ncbi:unnamed protein product, partial [Owenia fusiformis]
VKTIMRVLILLVLVSGSLACQRQHICDDVIQTTPSPTSPPLTPTSQPLTPTSQPLTPTSPPLTPTSPPVTPTPQPTIPEPTEESSQECPIYTTPAPVCEVTDDPKENKTIVKDIDIEELPKEPDACAKEASEREEMERIERERTFIFGTEIGWYPASFINPLSQEPDGFAHDLIRTVCEQCGRKCEVVVLPNDGPGENMEACLSAGTGLNNHHFDVCAGGTPTVQRKNTFSYSAPWGHPFRSIAYTLASSDINSLKDITSNHKIGVARSFYADKYCLRNKLGVDVNDENLIEFNLTFNDFWAPMVDALKGTRNDLEQVDVILVDYDDVMFPYSDTSLQRIGEPVQCADSGYSFMHRKDFDFTWFEQCLGQVAYSGYYTFLCNKWGISAYCYTVEEFPTPPCVQDMAVCDIDGANEADADDRYEDKSDIDGNEGLCTELEEFERLERDRTFTFTGQTIDGFTAQLVRETCEHCGRRCEFTLLPGNPTDRFLESCTAAFKGLRNGYYDACMDATNSIYLENMFSFSAPLMKSEQTIVVTRFDTGIVQFTDLRLDHKIGFAKTYFANKYCVRSELGFNVSDENVIELEIKGGNWSPLFSALRENKVDVILISDGSLPNSEFRLVGKPFQCGSSGKGLMFRKDSDFSWFDKCFNELVDNERYYTLCNNLGVSSLAYCYGLKDYGRVFQAY